MPTPAYRDGGSSHTPRAYDGAPGVRAGFTLIEAGFTLIELILVVLILAALAGLVLPYVADARDEANNARAMEEIRGLEIDISTYFAGHGVYPGSLSDIDRGTLEDPWGNPYRYLRIQGLSGLGEARKDRFVVPLNSDYDLYSAGKDGSSVGPLTASVSQDDIIRAGDGAFVGLASEY